MADRYWRGGSGTWDATSTTNWSATSGGLGGASAPTSADNVIFNSLSNTTLYTVTVGADAICADMTVGAPLSGAVTLSLGATAVINCYGSMTLAATNVTWTATAGSFINFLATSTGKTLTSNGVTFGACAIYFNGIGGGWTLGSSLICSNLFFLAGTFGSGNFNITIVTFNSTGTNTRSITLGSSTITISGLAAFTYTGSGLTFNAGTSQITCSNAAPTFAGGGLTFYNVTFSSTGLNSSAITGANTFNNLTYTARAAAGIGITTLDAGATQTINGTLTLGSGTTGIARLWVRSSTVGSPATLSVATLAAMTDIDFRDITVSGASSPWSGTRIGNCLGNTNITFTAARTVYWVSAASANWSGAVWSTTSGNTGGAAINFPLAQDSIVIDNAGLTTGNTITLNFAYNIGNLSFSTRSNAATFATGTAAPSIYGDYTLSSAITVSGTATLQFAKQSGTATITSAAKTFTQPVTINAPSGTVRINGDLTLGSTLTTTLTQGTLDLTNNGAGNFTLSTGIFSSSNSNTRAVTFGTGNITITGNAATVLNMPTATGFTYTGTPTINSTYSGSTGTRTIQFGVTAGGTEANALNYNISAGSDIVSFGGSATVAYKSITFTGFTGSLASTASQIIIYGNLNISSGMTLTTSNGPLTFSATSGTQQITTNGNTTIDRPFNQNGVGGIVQLQDNLTIGSTRTYTLTNGTLDLTGNSGNWTLSTGIFSSSNSNTRVITFGTGNITLTGNNASILVMGTVTGFSYTGTPTFNATYSGSVGTRQIGYAGTTGGNETNAISLNVSAGSDILNLFTHYKNLNFTGFSGTLNNNALAIYGNLTFSSGMTLSSGTNQTNFNVTSGTQQITTNGQTLDFPLRFNGLGGTFAFQDALTMGNTRTLTLNAGSLLLKSGTTNTVGTAVLSGNDTTNTKLGATTPGFAAFLQKVIGGELFASNITIQDSNVTPVDTWYADPTSIDGGNNTNWIFQAVSVAGHDAFLPQEIRHFKELDRKAKIAEANRIRAIKLLAYQRKLKFKKLIAPELISRKEEIEYQKLLAEQFPEEEAKKQAEKIVAEQTAKETEAKKREIKKELKRLEKEQKEAEANVAQLLREKELLIESVLQRQKAMKIQMQLAIIEKLRQEEMDDEQALLLLI